VHSIAHAHYARTVTRRCFCGCGRVVRWGQRSKADERGRDAAALTGWLRYVARADDRDAGDIEDFIGEGEQWAAAFVEVVHGERAPDDPRLAAWASWRDTAYAQLTLFGAHRQGASVPVPPSGADPPGGHTAQVVPLRPRRRDP
jgi:hypothetical protein